MTLTVTAVPLFSDNYAWLIRDSSGATAIIDPADAKPIIAAVDQAGGRLDMILLTHHHPDHVAGTDEVRAKYGAPVFGAAADAHRLPKLDKALKEGDTVKLGDTSAQVIETPGHTIGHISFHFPDGKALFCGDTLFSLGCGKLLEGTPADMFASLKKFAALSADTLAYCGHEYTQSNGRFAITVEPGNAALKQRVDEVASLRAAGKSTIPSTIRAELAENPFMRAKDAAELGKIRAAKDKF